MKRELKKLKMWLFGFVGKRRSLYMKKRMMPVLDAYELECEICRRLNMLHIEVDVRQTLFYDNYQNGCCKYCSVESIKESFCDNMSEKEKSVLEELLKILKEEGVEGDFLVDVSW
jgi:hypothetical protein